MEQEQYRLENYLSRIWLKRENISLGKSFFKHIMVYFELIRAQFRSFDPDF